MFGQSGNLILFRYLPILAFTVSSLQQERQFLQFLNTLKKMLQLELRVVNHLSEKAKKK
jgi:hypothetical protein